MLLIFEILFAIWIVSEFCSVLLGCGRLILAIAVHLVGYALTGVAALLEMCCRLWKTAFCDGEV